MCKKLEDCLFSRFGFRVCIVLTLVLILGALALNISIHYLKKKEGLPPGSEGVLGPQKSHAVQTVLLWTPVQNSWSGWRLEESTNGEYNVSQCDYKCAFTRKRSERNSANLILFSYSDFRASDLPTRHPHKDELWGLYHNKPFDRSNSSRLDSVDFNLVLSYLPNSDVRLLDPHLQELNESKSGGEKDEKHFQNVLSDLIDSASEGGKSIHQHIKHHFTPETTDESGRQKRRLDTDIQEEDDLLQAEEDDLSHTKELERNRRAYHYESRLVATLINQCSTPGNREGYIKALSSHLMVHTYGDCGVPCPGKDLDHCLQYLEKFYKYILVFESDVCEHYISDLVWKVLQTTMLPVVFGGGDYSKELPPGSYVDAMPQTPENLAHFLIYLNRNPAVYSTYFQWKKKYRIVQVRWECELCKLLHSTDPSQWKHLKSKDRRRLDHLQQNRCTSWPQLQFTVHH